MEPTWICQDDTSGWLLSQDGGGLFRSPLPWPTCSSNASHDVLHTNINVCLRGRCYIKPPCYFCCNSNTYAHINSCLWDSCGFYREWNLDYKIVIKLGVYERFRNYLTLSEFLAAPQTLITSDIVQICQYSLSGPVSIQLSRHTESWVRHYTSGKTVKDTVTILLKPFKNDLRLSASH